MLYLPFKFFIYTFPYYRILLLLLYFSSACLSIGQSWLAAFILITTSFLKCVSSAAVKAHFLAPGGGRRVLLKRVGQICESRNIIHVIVLCNSCILCAIINWFAFLKQRNIIFFLITIKLLHEPIKETTRKICMSIKCTSFKRSNHRNSEDVKHKQWYNCTTKKISYLFIMKQIQFKIGV